MSLARSSLAAGVFAFGAAAFGQDTLGVRAIAQRAELPAALVALLDCAPIDPPEAAAAALLDAAASPGILFAALTECHTLEGSALRPWGPPQRAALRAALTLAPPEQVVAAIRGAAGQGPAAALAAVEVLGATVSARRVGELFLAFEDIEDFVEERRVGRLVADACAACLTRWPGEAEQFARGWSLLDPRVEPYALSGLAAAPPEAAFAVAAGLLDSGAETELGALSVLLMTAPKVGATARARVAPHVRERLTSVDQALLGAAVRVAAALRDGDALPALIGLLEHEAPALRECAHRALRSLTGRGFPLDARAWRRWFAEEEAWWQRASALVPALDSGPAAAASDALRQLALRTTRTEERAALAARALEHRAPTVRALAALTLERLGSVAAHDRLHDLAEGDPDAGVRRAARRACGAANAE